MTTPQDNTEHFAPRILHATCVVAHGNGALIIGAAGRGKSSLALAMMAIGAQLVGDDRVVLQLHDHQVMATAPAPIRGLIEARGIGLLQTNPADAATVKVVIDLDQTEPDRLPNIRYTELLGQRMPLLYRVDAPHFPTALMLYLKSGRQGE